MQPNNQAKAQAKARANCCEGKPELDESQIAWQHFETREIYARKKILKIPILHKIEPKYSNTSGSVLCIGNLFFLTKLPLTCGRARYLVWSRHAAKLLRFACLHLIFSKYKMIFQCSFSNSRLHKLGSTFRGNVEKKTSTWLFSLARLSFSVSFHLRLLLSTRYYWCLLLHLSSTDLANLDHG